MFLPTIGRCWDIYWKVALAEMQRDHQSGAFILRRPWCSSVLIPILVPRLTCPACFRCYSASTHLIQVIRPSSSSAVEAGKHLRSSVEESYFIDQIFQSGKWWTDHPTDQLTDITIPQVEPSMSKNKKCVVPRQTLPLCKNPWKPFYLFCYVAKQLRLRCKPWKYIKT